MKFPATEWSRISDLGKDFLAKAIEKDPRKRASATTLLEHPWILADLEKNQAPLEAVSRNLAQFEQASDFQRVVIILLSGLKMQTEELSQLQALFQKWDKDKDGTLTKEEIGAGLRDSPHLELFNVSGEDSSDQLIRKMDMDNDGRIDYLEFIQAAIDHQALLNQNNLNVAFGLIDQNNDGEISMKELKVAFGEHAESEEHGRMLEEIMEQIDTNKDGSISLAEFNEACTIQLKQAAQATI